VDCAHDYTCVGTSCVPKTATCNADGTASVDTRGTPTACAPYRCGSGGLCPLGCASSDECQSGFVCDGSHCVSAAASTPESGGCVVHGHESSKGAWLSLLALAAAASVRAANRSPRRCRSGRCRSWPDSES